MATGFAGLTAVCGVIWSRQMRSVNLIEKLKGERLSSVTFVQYYIQLHFDGPVMNVFTPLTVCAGGRKERSWSLEFRNILCAQIAKKVKSVEYEDKMYLKLGFTDESFISISLVPDDYVGPEAVYFIGYDETIAI